MSDRYTRTTLSAISKPLQTVLTASTGANEVDRFQRALQRSSRRISEARADSKQQEDRPTRKQDGSSATRTSQASQEARRDSLTSLRSRDKLIESLAELDTPDAHTLLSGVDAPTSGAGKQQKDNQRTETLLSACTAAMEQQIKGAVRDASVTLDLPDNLFNGTSLVLKQSQGSWFLTATTRCTATHTELFSALPRLRDRFREKGLGTLCW